VRRFGAASLSQSSLARSSDKTWASLGADAGLLADCGLGVALRGAASLAEEALCIMIVSARGLKGSSEACWAGLPGAVFAAVAGAVSALLLSGVTSGASEALLLVSAGPAV